MFFSIVIPLYNKSYSIKRCIDSVLNQRYQKYELIIVNDGSTDNSVELISELYSKEIFDGCINIIDQTNQGVSCARNNGVKAAKFDYVCFLDGDDEWKCNFLEKMSVLIQDYPNADIYSLAHKLSINNKLPTKPKQGLPDGFRGYVQDFFKSSTKGSVVNSSKVCVKKAVCTYLGGFPVGVTAGEDLYLWIRFALNGKVACDMSYSAIVHREIDDSRGGRKNSVPYPLVYFSKNKVNTRKNLNRYLFVVFYKHFLSSLFSLRFREAWLRFFYYVKVYI